MAVVGIGCLFPKASGPGFYWANIKHGRDCISPVPPTHWNPDDYFDPDPKKPDMTYARRGGFLDVVEFDPLEFGIAPRDIEATDTTQLLGLIVAKQALADARLVLSDGRKQDGKPAPEVAACPEVAARVVDRSRVSVILGVTGTLELVIPLGARLGHPKWKRAMRDAGIPEPLVQDAVSRIADSYVPWQENSFPGLLGNVVAGRIANRLDLHGTNCVVDAACASSLSAVHLAALELQTGRADVVVTGGCDTFNDIFMYMCFSKTPALSPSGDARPFDAAGDGTILGEGLGVVVLKRLVDAERAGDTIYAVIRGIGSSSDGKGNAIYAPSAAGQRRCLTNAYTIAGVSPETVELVEAHGTGTRVGDATEVTALTEVYAAAAAPSRPRPWCALGSVKSQIGHTKAAAGAASLIKVALALHYKVLPPTIKVTQPLEPLAVPDSPFYLNTTMRPWLPRPEHPRRAALSAFGFGGSNFHAVLEEYRPDKRELDWDGSVEVVALSAATPDELLTTLGTIPTDWDAFARFAEESRRGFDPTAPFRLAFAAHRTQTDLLALLASARGKLAQGLDVPAWSTAEGVYYRRGAPPGKLAVLFPGQGSQAVGMFRDWACLFPEMLESLAAADAALQAESGEPLRLSDRIYPATSFDPEARSRQEAELRDTRYAQPGLGAVSFGAWRVLAERFGLRADAFAGHSYGELVALAAAGRLTAADLYRLSVVRGRLMSRPHSGDPGSMLAVFAPLARIEEILTSGKLDLVIANRNSPTQAVLSGATAEIGRAEQALAEAGIRSIRLPVAAAFHSPLVSQAVGPFREALASIPLVPGPVPVYSNTTAREYPADADEARTLLAEQLARPVRFWEQVQALYQAGVRTFLEVGPGRVLTKLVEATLTEATVPGAVPAEVEAIPIDSGPNQASSLLHFGQVLARLAARGHPVRLAAWEQHSRCRPSATPPQPGRTIPLTGANYVAPRSPKPPSPPARLVDPGTRHPSVSRPDALDSQPFGGPVEANPMPDSTPPNDLTRALLLTQKSLTALQQMQEQTAALHKQFLESQEAAQRTLQVLVEQQQALLGATLGKRVGDAPGVVPPSTRPVAPASSASVPIASVAASPPPPPPPLPPPSPPAPAGAAQAAHLTPPRAVPPVDSLVKTPIPHRTPNRVADTLLAVVSEKTGYPVESLDLGLSLDADLGVDSIKRVEILSALQERLPEAPAVRPEHLGTLHTLRDLADFLGGAARATTGETGLNGSRHDELTRTQPVRQDQLPLVTPASSSLSAPSSDRPKDPARREGVTKPTSAGTSSGVTSPAVSSPSSGLTRRPPVGTVPDVAAILLAVVSEKTGYPVESLDLGLSLDADLGVDSIKRVEILSALQERLPEAPAVRPEHLGTLHTLRDLADFLGKRQTPAAAGVAESVHASALKSHSAPVTPLMEIPAAPEPIPDTEQVSAIPPAPGPDSTQNRVIAAVGPGDTLTRSLPNPKVANRSAGVSLGSDRIERSILQAVDLDQGGPRPRLPVPADSELFIVGDAEPLTGAVAELLARQGLQPRTFGWADPPVEPSGSLFGLVLLAPVSPSPDLNRQAFLWLKSVAPRLRRTARHGAAVLVSVARLDGAFGLAELGVEADPTGGGLAGLVKTARYEWPEVYCKALDLSPAFTIPQAAAAAIVDEILLSGPVEVGLAPTHRCSLELARTVRRPNPQLIDLGSRDVILVTGGARGVTAEVAVALAETYTPTLILTGRTPTPNPEPAWLAGVSGEAALKRAISEALGPDAGPKAVGEFYGRVMAQREVRRTLDRIAATKARVAYLPVDVTDEKAVADMLHQVRVKYGPITALVHGAGVLADKRIEDLTPQQFDYVYSTKVTGLRNLLELLGSEELKALVLFSSTTARFGRTGQIAYACANEVLNKTAQVEARRRPGCRVVSINWGPWDGGMVTPSLRTLFESEGVGLIPLKEGALFLLQELNAAGKSVEVIAMARPRGGGGGAGSGVIPVSGTLASATPPPLGNTAPGSVSGTTPPAPELTLAFERSVDTQSHPVLKAHVIDGRVVVPMAVQLEWLAHAALHGNPGLVFHGFNDLRVTSGIQIEPAGTVPLRAMAGKAVRQDKLYVVPVELRGKRKDGRDVIHARAEIVLVAALPAAPPADPPPAVTPYSIPVSRAYQELLFHGPELQGIERVEGLSDSAFIGTAYPAPPPADWFRLPLRSGWVTDPLVLDASFQMMILWTQAQHASGSLPCFVGRYRQFRRSFPADPVTVVIRVRRDDGKFARADIDYLDRDGRVIALMQDYECVIERSLNQAFRKNQISHE